MIIQLGKINTSFSTIRKNTKVVLYADFYVLNFLYTNNIKIPENIHLYYDSTLVYLLIRYFFCYKIKKQISTDFQELLLQKLVLDEKKIFFFGDTDLIIKKLKTNLESKFPKINIVGCESGYEFNTEDVINKINLVKPDVLFIGLGVGRQEPWIIENFNKVHVDKIISVGGWFQFLASEKKRAPLILRKFHLEWLFKLITEFRRVWKRYFFVLPKFLLFVFSKKIELKIIPNE